MIRGTVQFNDHDLVKGQQSFSREHFEKLVRRKMKGNPLVSVRMDRLECPQAIMNDLIEFTIETIAEEGL